MDRKTAYTRTFMQLLEQPIHDETIKNSYYAWWQNVPFEEGWIQLRIRNSNPDEFNAWCRLTVAEDPSPAAAGRHP